MTWTKIDDQFSDHPKLTQLDHATRWHYLCGLIFASRYLTDGFIPARALARLSDVPDPDAAVQALCVAGLWAATEGGYQIHDYLDYNRSAAQVRAEREATARRMAKLRSQRNGPGLQLDLGCSDPTGGGCDGVTSLESSDVTASVTASRPGPARPGPGPGPVLQTQPVVFQPGGERGAAAPPHSPPGKPKALNDRVTAPAVDEEFIRGLMARWRGVLDEDHVRDSVAAALATKSCEKFADVRPHVRNWVRDDAERRQREEQRRGTGYPAAAQRATEHRTAPVSRYADDVYLAICANRARQRPDLYPQPSASPGQLVAAHGGGSGRHRAAALPPL